MLKKANLNKAFVAESESESEVKPAKKTPVKPPKVETRQARSISKTRAAKKLPASKSVD